MQVISGVVEKVGGLGKFLRSHLFDIRETPFVDIMIRPL